QKPEGKPFRLDRLFQERSAIHEEPSVKTGARRLWDFPDIHSASSALQERHEKVCGCSHSHRRRRNPPWRTPGCNLSPALDLDVDLLGPPFARRFTIGTMRLGPHAPARWFRASASPTPPAPVSGPSPPRRFSSAADHHAGCAPEASPAARRCYG